METILDRFIKGMNALSDPSRLKIIKMLQQKPICVCEIQKAPEIIRMVKKLPAIKYSGHREDICKE